MKNIIRT